MAVNEIEKRKQLLNEAKQSYDPNETDINPVNDQSLMTKIIKGTIFSFRYSLNIINLPTLLSYRKFIQPLFYLVIFFI